jgi:hypothetical protein
MKTLNVLFAAMLASGGVVAKPAMALLIPGGPTKSAAADCYGELDVDPLAESDITTNSKGKPTVECSDGDGTCDSDAQVDGQCVFNLRTCINQTNVAECTPPQNLEKVTAKGKAKGVKGKIVVNVEQLLEGSVCGSFLNFTVPVKKATNKKPAKAGSGTITMKAKAPKGTKPRKDTDKFELICIPNENGCNGSASGAFLDR